MDECKTQLPPDVEGIGAAKEDREGIDSLEFKNRILLTILDSLDDPIYISDPSTFRLLYVNQAFKKSWGDGLGAQCYKVLQNRETPCGFCSNPQIFGENLGKPFVWEFRNRANLRWYRCIDRAIEWPDGRWVRSEIAVDITKQKEAEQEQRNLIDRARRQQETIMMLAAHPALVQGQLDAAIREISEQVSETLNVERVGVWRLNENRSELRCVDLYERTPAKHSSGVVLQASHYPRYFASLAAARGIDADLAMTDPRCSEFREDYLAPLGITSMLDSGIRVGGLLIGVICCEHVGEPRHWQRDEVMFAAGAADQAAQAILNYERSEADTALRESEERLQLILNRVQAGILLIDAEAGIVADANPAALALIGATREEALGRKCLGFLCPQAGGCIMKRERDVNNREGVLLDAKGREQPILQTVIPITLRGRSYYLKSFVDLAEHKRTEEELREKVRDLDQAKHHLEMLVSDTTARERRMIELKEEVNELLTQQGLPAKYKAPQSTAGLRSGR